MVRGLRRYLSLAIAALVLASLGLPLASIIAEAQTDRVFTYNAILTPGGELGFVIERYGAVLPAGPTFFFFLTTDTSTSVRQGDVLVGNITHQAFASGGTFYVVGTILVSGNLPTGSYYLKVATSKQIGAPAVVSGRTIYYLSDPARIRDVLVVLNNATKRSADSFAFFSNPAFGVANRIQVIVNLSRSGMLLAAYTDVIQNADRFNVSLVHQNQVLRVSADFANPPNVHIYDFLYTPGLKTFKDTGYRFVNLSGRIGNFSLCCYTEPINIKGINFASQSFTVVASLYRGLVNVPASTGMPAYVVRLGEVSAPQTAPVNVLLPNASIARADKIRLFPSVGVKFIQNADVTNAPFGPGVANGTIINVGDNAKLDFRNFRTTALFTAHFFALEGGAYVSLYSLGETLPVPISNGAGGPVDYLIVPNPYGGRIIQVTVNATKEPLFAMTNITEVDAHRIRPIFEARGLHNDTLTPTISPRYVPGEYIVVRGLGYLVDNTTRLRLTNGAVSYPVRLIGHSIFPNGTYVGIYQVRQDALINDGGKLNATLGTVAPNEYMLRDRSANYTSPVVIIDPSPRVLGVNTTAPRVFIATSVEKFANPATWEEESKRVFSLLVYGFPQGTTRFDLTMIGPLSIVYLANVPASGRGVLNLTHQPVPELPHGAHRVRAIGGTTSALSSSVNLMRILQTAAILDPADNVFKKRVFLPAAQNITVRAYGFIGNADVYADLPTLGLQGIDVSVGPAQNPTRAKTNDRGTLLAGWIDLPALNPGPGLHVIVIRTGGVSDEVRVIIGQVPPLQLKLAVSPSQFADMPVGVYGIVTFGGEIARAEQIISIVFRAMLTRTVPTMAHAFVELTPVQIYPNMAIYFAQFVPTALGEAVKGKEVAVLGTVTARFAAGAPLSRGADIVAFGVPEKTLVEEIQSVVMGITDLKNMVNALMARLNATADMVGTIAGDVSAIKSDVSAIRALLVTVDGKVGAIDTKVSNVLTAVIALSSANDQVLARLTSLNATVSGGIAMVRTDIAGLTTMLRNLNASIASVVREEGSAVRASIVSSRDAIIGVVRANATALATLIREANNNVVTVRNELRALVDAIATFRSESVTRLEAISTAVSGVREDVSRARETVTNEVKAVMNEVKGVATSIVTLSNKVDGVKSAVDGVVTAVRDVAKKTDVTEAVKDLAKKSDVEAVKTEIQGVGDTASTSARNWGLINAVLIIVAIALVAYSTFFSQKK